MYEQAVQGSSDIPFDIASSEPPGQYSELV